MILKRNIFASLVTAALLLVLGVESASAGGVLRIGRSEDSTTMDSIKTTQNVDIWVINNVHAFLVRSNREGNDIEPDLAKSWDISDDKLTFTFHLREAKFSDGSPVTAKDAAFSILRLRDDEESTQRSLFQVIKSAEATDEHTLVLRLSEPSAAFLSTLAMYVSSVVPEKAVMEMGDKYGTSPVSAGAYRVKEWRRGEVLTLEPNPHYWVKNHSKLDRIEWQVVPDDNTRVLKVQAGELDAAILIPFALLPSVENDPNINIHLDPSTREDSMLFNHTNKWLGKKSIRQAISMAINIDAIVQVVTFGRATPANSLMPAGTLYYNKDNKRWPYDPEKAKSIIEQEGATGAEFSYLVPGGNAIREQIAVIVQQQLAAVGLKVNIDKIDPGQNWGALVDGKYDLATVYWTYDILDPDQKVAFSVGADENKSYFTRYDNPDVSKLVKEARLELDSEKRRQLYYKIQATVQEDAFWYDLYYSPFSNISRKNVKGFYQNPLGIFPLHEFSVE